MPGNLRATVSRFFGREAELERVQTLLSQGERLVTLCGEGGAGKTRLALELLPRVASPYSAGAWFCDASGARSAEELLRAVAEVLDVELGAHPQAQLTDAIAARGPLLLCLDNLEQIVEPAATIAAGWLAACSELSLLTTSRARLGIDGEHVVRVPPLTDHGVALFVDRARRAGAAVEDADHERVAEIVASLDHHPLAIELAAARCVVVSVEELAQMLPRRWEMLEERRRDAPPRHHSLSASLWWSYELLAPAERELFVRCATFAGAFTRHDVATMVGQDAIASLATLQQASLLRTERTPAGLTMSMFVALRDFGRARLVDLQIDARRDHARWVLTRAGEAERIGQLVELMDDAVLAHDWAIASDDADALALAARILARLGPAFEARGPVSGPLARWDAILARLEGPPAWAFMERARLRRMAGRLDEALADLDTATAAAPKDFAVALERSKVLYAAGRMSDALRAARRAQALAADDRERGLAATQLGRLEHGSGHPRRARALHVEALKALAEPQHRLDRGSALAALGFTDQDLGDSAHAETCLREALAIYRELEHRRDAASILGYLGNVHRSRRDRARAEACYDEAIATFRAQGAKWFEAVFTMDRGILLSLLGDAQARAVLEAALAAGEASDNRRLLSLVLGHLAVLAADDDRLDEASALFDRAESGLDDPRDGQFPAVLALQRHHLELARRRAGRADLEVVERARAALDAPPPVESDHMRLARAILQRACDRTAPPSDAYLVADDGSWFDAAERIDLRAHPAMGRVLRTLAELDDGAVATVDELFEAGWPDERAVAAARKNRVRVALSGLRKKGVPIAFDRRAGGYALKVPAVVVDRDRSVRATTTTCR